MKDFENDLIYYPNPDPVKEPRFILKCVDELEKSTKYSVTCNGTERVVYHTDSFDYVVVVDNEAYDLEISSFSYGVWIEISRSYASLSTTTT